MYAFSLERIITPDNVCKKNSLAILDYAFRNRIIDLLVDKYMDKMEENLFATFIDRAIKEEWPEGANRYIEFYNKKFGGTNRLKI